MALDRTKRPQLRREQTSLFRLAAKRNGQSVNETVSEPVLRPLLGVIADGPIFGLDVGLSDVNRGSSFANRLLFRRC